MYGHVVVLKSLKVSKHCQTLRNEDVEILRRLLNEKADPKQKTSNGYTALQLAIKKNKRGSHAEAIIGRVILKLNDFEKTCNINRWGMFVPSAMPVHWKHKEWDLMFQTSCLALANVSVNADRRKICSPFHCVSPKFGDKQVSASTNHDSWQAVAFLEEPMSSWTVRKLLAETAWNISSLPSVTDHLHGDH